MTWYKEVHAAIHHIMERHDMVYTALYVFVPTCPGIQDSKRMAIQCQ
jgi:hypothetical protein